MRITLINQFFSPDISPTAKLAASLANDRARLGDDVSVITSRSCYALPSNKLNQEGCRDRGQPKLRVIRTRSLGLGQARLLGRAIHYVLFFLQAIWHVLRLQRQDVVIAMTTPPLIALVTVMHKGLHPQTRLVLWNMDCFPDTAERTGLTRHRGILSGLLHWLARFCITQADHVVCLDESMKTHIQEVSSAASQPTDLRVIPNWEQRQDFPSHAELLRPNSFPLELPYTVTYAGNLGRGHQFDTVLQAAALLKDEPLRFLFNGDGYRRREVHETCLQHGLNNVQLQNYVTANELEKLLRSSLCGVITLRDAMCGIMSPSKLHALLAMGVPVLYVGPRGSNVDAAITDYGCGLSLRHGEVKELAHFLVKLMKEPTYRMELRRNARIAFEDRYNDQLSLRKFDRLLKQTAA